MRALEWWEWLGLGAAGGVLYLIFKPSDANAMTAPTTDSGHVNTPGVPVHRTSDPPVVVHASAPPMPPPNAGPDAPRPDASATLVNRLRTSEQARKVFAYQSLLWSWGHSVWTFGHSVTVPDGVMTPGGPTEAKIRDINYLAHDTQPVSGDFNDGSLLKAQAVLGSLQPNANYLLPYKLPRDVIDAVNRTIGHLGVVGVTLQVVPA